MSPLHLPRAAAVTAAATTALLLCAATPAAAAGATSVVDRETVSATLAPSGRVDSTRLISQLTVTGAGRVTVADPVGSTTAALSGCTPTSTTPPPSTSSFQIDDRPPGDGNVGTD